MNCSPSGVVGKNANEKFALIFLAAALLLFITGGTCAAAVRTADLLPLIDRVELTEEEKHYISARGTIRAASLTGGAPIQFLDSAGEVRGISRLVLDRISEMTGLVFEYSLYESVDEATRGDIVDLVFGIPLSYATPIITLSEPFLNSETIIYMNASVDPHDLRDKMYAAVSGGALPPGIDEKNVLYFKNREESLNAVNSGKADYAYGNSYSVAYYTLMHGYKNIVSIPRKIESRAYCMGVLNNDSVLLDIINKSIKAIDPDQMQTLLMDVASHVDRKITYLMVLETYALELALVTSVIIALLIFGLFTNWKAGNELKLRNTRYEVLSNIANECFYVYEFDKKNLRFSEKCVNFLKKKGIYKQALDLIKNTLPMGEGAYSERIFRIISDTGQTSVFRTVNACVRDDHGKLDSIIGKLVDITEETAEKEELIARALHDGLTGLLNPTTTKERIIERLASKDDSDTDVMIIIDIDNFKEANDKLGHLAGDRILVRIANDLKSTFGEDNIYGRIGGDEFCAYIQNPPSLSAVVESSDRLIASVTGIVKDFFVSVSIGVAQIKERESYEKSFEKADRALYLAKKKGKAQTVVYNETDGDIVKTEITL